ncbi:MAG: peptidoglycan DD-metalloendopeptidase family protein [Endomicrobium sp.]|nr:peptidoglycan DD-metalloendopeptidase family protein [Endomicrobium sp.]
MYYKYKMVHTFLMKYHSFISYRSTNVVLKIFFLCFFLFNRFAIIAAKNEDTQTYLRQLNEIKKSLKEKKTEKDKLIIREKKTKNEIKVLDNDIKENEKNLKKMLLNIKLAKSNIKKFSINYSDSLIESAKWNRAIVSDAKLLNKIGFTLSYEQNPIEYKIIHECLKYKNLKLENEKKNLFASAANIEKWKTLKEEFLNLQHKENILAIKHKNILNDKNKLLKTTLNKKIIAEKEINSLNNTAKALQNLIDKIIIANKQKQLKKPILTQKTKNLFSWPVDGKVVVNFGKSKHPELDTYIISNGIKISAPNFSKVKSVNSGVVIFVGQFRSYGKIIIIDHNDEIFTIYGLLSKIFVKEKDKVSKEKIIAELGSGEDNILYFEVRYKSVPNNPMLWFKVK